MSDVFIAGTGVSLGERQPCQGPHAAAGWESVSVEHRRTAAEMATAAGREALNDARVGADELGAVLHVNLLDDETAFWGSASAVARGVGALHAPAFNLRQSCNGGLAAVQLAQQLIGRSHQPVLITTADRYDAPIVCRWHGDNGVFGDGATAVVLNPDRGCLQLRGVCTRADNSLEGESDSVAGEQSVDFEARREAFFRERVALSEYLQRIEAAAGSAIDDAIASAGVGLSEISHFLVASIDEGLQRQQVSWFFNSSLARTGWGTGRAIGHLGAGDQFAALHELLAQAQLNPGDWLLLFGGGTGYSVTTAVFQATDAVRHSHAQSERKVS